MKRRQPKDAKPGRRVQDIKKAYTQEQLTEIGSITLKWNQIDFFVDCSDSHVPGASGDKRSCCAAFHNSKQVSKVAEAHFDPPPDFAGLS